MHKFLIIAAIFLPFRSSAQVDYFEDNQMWDCRDAFHYTGITCAVVFHHVYYVHTDTFINNHNYKCVGKRSYISYQLQQPPGTCASPSTPDNPIEYLVRQTNDSIMIYNPALNSEELMIDYDLNVGDTLAITAFVPDTFVVQSISSILIGSQSHRVFHIDTINNYTVIEGLGFFGHFVSGMFTPIHFTQNSPYYYRLNCYAQNGVTSWQDQWIYAPSCDYLYYLSNDDIADNISPNELEIYPNPNNGRFTVSNLHDNAIIEIHSTTGKIVYKEQISTNSKEIDFGAHPPGVYIILIYDKNELVVTKRLVKSN